MSRPKPSLGRAQALSLLRRPGWWWSCSRQVPHHPIVPFCIITASGAIMVDPSSKSKRTRDSLLILPFRSCPPPVDNVANLAAALSKLDTSVVCASSQIFAFWQISMLQLKSKPTYYLNFLTQSYVFGTKCELESAAKLLIIDQVSWENNLWFLTQRFTLNI